MRQSLEDWKANNYKASTQACAKAAERCFKRIQTQKNQYSADTADKLSKDINDFVQRYSEENLGPAQSDYLMDFMDKNIVSLFRELAKTEEDKKAEAIAKGSQKQNLLEKDVDALDSQYRELKKELQTQQDMVLQIQSEKSQKDREVKNF